MGRHNLPHSSKYDKGRKPNIKKSNIHTPPQPRHSSSQNSSNSSDCFIATAVYGSEKYYNIEILQNYRDEVLLTNYLGRTFVNIYYTISPPIANLISKRPLIKKIIRVILLDPLIKGLKK